jgi:microcystin degradation protein MlrC
MKLFTATLYHETNSFSPVPTSLDSYREMFLFLPSTGEGEQHAQSLVADVNFCQLARARGHEAHQGLMAGAQASMPMTRETWQRLRDELLTGLRDVLPVDAVVVFLHGAQMAESTDDCEGELLQAIREIVGPQVVVGVLLDLHANVSDAMVKHADLTVSCQEYPHTDFESRGAHLLELVERAVAGDIAPVTACARIPMLGSFPTTREPMRSFVDKLAGLQKSGAALTVSVIHGFAWSDVPFAGASMLVCCDGDIQHAGSLARDLAREFFAMRDEIVTPALSMDVAIERALSEKHGPVVIADTADNPGGGAPGDSTYLLRRIVELGIENVGVAMIYDPAAVRFAMAAGEGAELELRIGGKLSALSGDPLDLRVTVKKVSGDAVQLRDVSHRRLGDAVAVECNGVEIVLCSVREQTFTAECFTELGIDPTAKRILSVKSHQHFFEDFSRFASRVLYATAPGVINRNFAELPYERIARPVWPIDAPPFAAFGQHWGSAASG